MLTKKHTSFLMGFMAYSIVSFSTPASAIMKLPPQDYVEAVRSTDFYSNRIDDKFLTTLANEYKSYALFKANFTPDYKGANHFAIKAINTYHGEYVKPENIYKKNLPAKSIIEISNYYDDLIHLLDTDLVFQYPQLMAEAQAKFDCWVDSEANGLSPKQSATCQSRFMKARNHLFAKLDNDCNCAKKNKNKKEVQKKTITKYDGKILSIPKWPNLPVIANNPPIPVVRHTVVKELTVSKEIKEAILKIDQSIKDINVKLNAHNQTKTDIDNIKKQISELKDLLKNSSQKDFAELQKKLSELEDKLSNISCENMVETEEIEEQEENTNTEEDSNENNEPKNIIKETSKIEPIEDEILVYESIDEEVSEDTEEDADNENDEGEEEYFDEEEEEEPEFEEVDEEEYIEVEVSNASSNLLPYEVFFNWNDATVNPKFNNSLKDIANNAKKSKEIIVIKGHTDASGTPEYNQKLSKKRAENVGKIIMSYGVPREKIILQGVGSTEPKVKTKVGEKNAENRRVVIK